MLGAEAWGGEGKNPKTVSPEAKGDVSRLGMGASCPRSQAMEASTIAHSMHSIRFMSGSPLRRGARRAARRRLPFGRSQVKAREHLGEVPAQFLLRGGASQAQQRTLVFLKWR